MRRVVVVGQTPPPIGGQATMIQTLITSDLPGVEVVHVELGAAKSAADRGRFAARKLVHALGVVIRVLWLRARTRADTLYFPPSSDRLPVLRDALILTCTRWAFARTVLHFHAGGLGETIEGMPAPVRFFVRRAFARPDVAIRLTEASPDDPSAVRAAQQAVVPYGLPDRRPGPRLSDRPTPPVILFAGVIIETKGVLVALDALGALRDRGCEFRARFVGPWGSHDFEAVVRRHVTRLRLESLVSFTGPLSGDTYLEEHDAAFVFCFPTFFESETFGLVALEAMRARTPVVASDWRGVRALVDDGVTGMLVPARDDIALAGALEHVLADAELAQQFADAGRARYEQYFTEDVFLRSVSQLLGG